MELEIAKISPAQIRRVTTECLSILPRKINWKKWKLNVHLIEKFYKWKIRDPKFFARIYYNILHHHLVTYDEINYKYFVERNALKEIAAEYKKHFLRNDFGLDSYGLDHLLFCLATEENIDLFFGGIENFNSYRYPFEDFDRLDIYPKHVIHWMVKNFTTDSLTKNFVGIIRHKTELAIELFHLYPHKFTVEKLTDCICQEFDIEWNCMDFILSMINKK